MPEKFASADAAYYTSMRFEDVPEDFVRTSFAAICRCGNPNCGEVVSIGGEAEYVDADFEGHQAITLVLRARSMYPAPPLLTLSDEVPRPVKMLLTRSFELYWMDENSCANAMRSACEYILDHLKVPRSGVSQKGKPVDYDLNGRIQILSRRRSQKPNAAVLNALRIFGNLGSHGNAVTQLHLMTAYQFMELLLNAIFNKQKTAELRKLARQVVKTKGKKYY
jgi:hypothetical protein